MDFIINNWETIVGLVVIVVGFIISVRNKELKSLEVFIYGLVSDAEAMFGGSGMGEIKFSYVSQELYKLIPDMIKPFITQKKIGEMIDFVLTAAKKKWEEVPALKEYVSGVIE